MGQDWMKRGPLEPDVKEVGEQLKIQVILEKNKHNNKNVILMLTVPSAEYDFHETNCMCFLPNVQSYSADDISSRLKSQNKSLSNFIEQVTVITHNLGKAAKAGCYAYRLVDVRPEGWVNVLSSSIGTDKPSSSPEKTLEKSDTLEVGLSDTLSPPKSS